jgi:TRAP-type C4-dicarboxylate transport system permease small subunit
MKKFIEVCDKIANIGGTVSAVIIVISLLLVTIEMIVRSMFKGTLYITEEYTSYLVAAFAFLSLAYTFKEKGHIRVTILHKFVGKRTILIFDIIVIFIAIIVCCVVTVTTFQFFLNAIVNNTRSMQITRTPLAIPQFFLPLGMFLFVIQLVAEFFRSIQLLREGKEAKVESSALGR